MLGCRKKTYPESLDLKVESGGWRQNDRGINSDATPWSEFKGCYARVLVKVAGGHKHQQQRTYPYTNTFSDWVIAK